MSRDISLADAVRALKLVKADLDKHKQLLAQKNTENLRLASDLASAQKSEATKPPGVGLEFEAAPPVAPGDGKLEKEAAELRAQVQELKGAVADADGDKRKLTELEASSETVKKENEAMKIQVSGLESERVRIRDAREAAAELAAAMKRTKLSPVMDAGALQTHPLSSSRLLLATSHLTLRFHCRLTS